MLKIFVDFDGTITRRDVGDAMFEQFGGQRCAEIIDEYRNGALSAVECFTQECAACGDVEKSALDAFLDGQEIDPTFLTFVQFCRERGFGLFIVSDGMDYYIRRILGRTSAGDVPFFANRLELIPVEASSRVRLVPEFPHRDEVCDRCACCKRNHMLTLSGDDDLILYIGEGYSDRCPARYADIVFAKDDLKSYCRNENISYVEYTSFAGVLSCMQRLLDGNNGPPKLRKRRQAELSRRELFLGG